MTDDALSFLEDVPEAPKAEPAKVEPEVEVQADKGEEPATPPVAQEADKGVPLVALLDEREKRHQAAREADELRRELAALKAQAQPKAKPIDVLEDPEGFARQQQQMLQQAILDDRLERSRYMAVEKHGEAKINEVISFFNDPQHAPKTHEFKFHPDPVGAAIRYYEEQQELTRLRSEGGLSAYETKLREQIRAELLAEVQSGGPKPATPPPSLASAASSGAAKAPPVNGFDAMFGA
jgi:hypothetical protein